MPDTTIQYSVVKKKQSNAEPQEQCSATGNCKVIVYVHACVYIKLQESKTAVSNHSINFQAITLIYLLHLPTLSMHHAFVIVMHYYY